MVLMIKKSGQKQSNHRHGQEQVAAWSSNNIAKYQRFSTCGPCVDHWWSASKGYVLFCKDMNTQTDQFWQFSMAQFSVAATKRQNVQVCRGGDLGGMVPPKFEVGETAHALVPPN